MSFQFVAKDAFKLRTLQEDVIWLILPYNRRRLLEISTFDRLAQIYSQYDCVSFELHIPSNPSVLKEGGGGFNPKRWSIWKWVVQCWSVRV